MYEIGKAEDVHTSIVLFSTFNLNRCWTPCGIIEPVSRIVFISCRDITLTTSSLYKVEMESNVT